MPATPAPRWLSVDDQIVWRDYLRATMEIGDGLDKDLARTHGLSMNEYEVLVVLSEQPSRSIRMSTLADQLANSRSRLTHTVRRMEQRGLVAREASQDDGRGVNCTLTDKGFEVLAEAAPDHVESVRRHIFDKLTRTEARQLGAILAKLGDV